MSGSVFRVVALLAATVALASASEVTPVQKVLQMMNEIKQKGIEEKEAEEVTFTKFSMWCSNTDKHKDESIARAAAAIEELKAKIEKLNSDAVVLGQEIQDLDAQTESDSKDKAAATKERATEKADYDTAHAEHVTSLDELGRATEELKQMMASAPAAASASFLQEFSSTRSLTSSARRVISLVSTSMSTIEAAPEAAAFESQSGGIVDMMVELHDKLKDEDATLTTEEMESKHAYQMLAQTLTDKIEKQTASRNRKASTKKEKERLSAEAAGELSDTVAAKKADEAYLMDLRTTCEQKHTDFEARQKLRAEELEALDKAIEIIAGGAVSGAADAHLPALAQVKTAFVQLRANAPRVMQSAAASFLEHAAKRIDSQVLLAISSRVTSSPFKKVTKMIKDMIMKLTQEATEEAEHKGFCDTELSTNQQTRDSKTAEVDELTATIEGLAAKCAKLSKEITELSADIAALDAAVAKATAQREEEKAKNAATLADAQGAIAAVTQAMDVLKEFYEKAAGATALAQVRTAGVDDDMPETFDKPFTGMGGEGGIVGMLEVILSDFQRLEAETTENEANGAREYGAFMEDSKMDTAVKGQEVKNKEDMKQKAESEKQDASSDLKAAQAELDAALEYFDKLKPSCVDAGVSYEERVARREEEVQSLNQALTILGGEAVE